MSHAFLLSSCVELDTDEKLTTHGGLTEPEDTICGTELIRAVKDKPRNEVTRLLSGGCNEINSVNCDNQTALSVACEKDITALIELLLKHGADPNIGASPLVNKYCNVKLLLRHGLNPNGTNKYGETLIMRAAKNLIERKDEDKVLKMMMNRSDVDVNVRDQQGRALLHLAAMDHTLFFLIPVLLKNGADLTREDACGRTVLHYLLDDRTIDGESLVGLAFSQLLRMHVNVNHRDCNGNTAMHGLCINIAFSLVRKDLKSKHDITMYSRLPFYFSKNMQVFTAV